MLAPFRRNQILAAGTLATLLGSAAPALAYSSFDVLFDSSLAGTSTEGTGVSGKMTFNFTKNTGNEYTLDLAIENTTKISGNPTGTLVGFAFNVPGKTNIPPDIKLLTYNPLTSGFGDVYGATANGQEANVADNSVLTIATNPRQTSLNPFGSFTFCARDSGSNCVGGPANGLADGAKTAVRFTLASNLSNVNTAEAVGKSFYDLFNSWTPGVTGSNPQVALRFQNVTTSTGVSGQSDKVGGKPKPPEAPPDGVPGPVPALGAAAAFGFSRRLRRRIALARGRQAASI
jgi:hypothetical protein